MLGFMNIVNRFCKDKREMVMQSKNMSRLTRAQRSVLQRRMNDDANATPAPDYTTGYNITPTATTATKT